MRPGVFARIAAQIEPNRNHQCSQCEVANARPMPRMPINSGLSRLTIRVDSSLIPTSLTKTSCRQAFASSERLRLSLLRLSATQLPLYASKRFLAVRIDAFQGLPDFSEAASSLDQFPRLAVSARISIGAVAHPSTETFAVAILSVVPVRAVHAVGAIPSRRIQTGAFDVCGGEQDRSATGTSAAVGSGTCTGCTQAAARYAGREYHDLGTTDAARLPKAQATGDHTDRIVRHKRLIDDNDVSDQWPADIEVTRRQGDRCFRLLGKQDFDIGCSRQELVDGDQRGNKANGADHDGCNALHPRSWQRQPRATMAAPRLLVLTLTTRLVRSAVLRNPKSLGSLCGSVASIAVRRLGAPMALGHVQSD